MSGKRAIHDNAAGGGGDERDNVQDKRAKVVEIAPSLSDLLARCTPTLLVEAYNAYVAKCYVAAMTCLVSAAVQDFYGKLLCFAGKDCPEFTLLEQWNKNVNDYKWTWENVENGLPRQLVEFGIISEREEEDWRGLIKERNRCVHPQLDCANEGFYVPMPEKVAFYIRLVASQLVLRSLRFGTVSNQKKALLKLVSTLSGTPDDIQIGIEKLLNCPLCNFSVHALDQVAASVLLDFLEGRIVECSLAASWMNALCRGESCSRARFEKEVRLILQSSRSSEQHKRLWQISHDCDFVRSQESSIPIILQSSFISHPQMLEDEAMLHLLTKTVFLSSIGPSWADLRKKLVSTILLAEHILLDEARLVPFLDLLPNSLRIDEGIRKLDGESQFESNNRILNTFLLPVRRDISVSQEARIRSLAESGSNNQIAGSWAYRNKLLPFLETRAQQ